jgi:hypothetical protein
MMNPLPNIPENIVTIAQQLNRLHCDFAFLGGAVLNVLITDKGAPKIRTTKDVDVVVGTFSRIAYTALEEKLRELGFKNDVSPGAPICRWIFKDIILDVMPPAEKVLGWKTRWLHEALKHAKALSAEPSIKVVEAPYFLATKIEAFFSRGNNDYLGSHDLEDFVSVVNGRETIVQEIANSDKALRNFLAKQAAEWLENVQFLEALDGHLADEENLFVRKKIVIQRLKETAQHARVK